MAVMLSIGAVILLAYIGFKLNESSESRVLEEAEIFNIKY